MRNGLPVITPWQIHGGQLLASPRGSPRDSTSGRFNPSLGRSSFAKLRMRCGYRNPTPP
jgi:hypothetical protein